MYINFLIFLSIFVLLRRKKWICRRTIVEYQKVLILQNQKLYSIQTLLIGFKLQKEKENPRLYANLTF